jgi:hypothetical protein
MTLTELASWSQVVVTAINSCLFIWLVVITRRYARATGGLLDTTRTASYGTVYIWAADMLSKPECVKARSTVMNELPKYKGTLEEMPDDLKVPFELTCRTYDLVGIAGENGMLPPEIIAREWGNSIINTHDASERFLKKLREDRGEMFWDNFTKLYGVAKRVWH